MRVAFLTNMVSPYRAPVLRDLSATPDWHLRVFVDVAREIDRAHWGISHEGLDVELAGSFSIKRTVRSKIPTPFTQSIELHLPYGLYRRLQSFRPTVIIAHELGARTLVAAAYAKANGIPLVIWSYQSQVSATQGSWRTALRTGLLRQATVVVGMGREARQVLEAWGVPADKIVDAPNAPNVEGLRQQLASPSLPAESARLRELLGAGRKIALVSGRLVPLKGTTHLLDTWKQLPAELRADWRLVFMGDGPLRGAVEAAAPDAISVGNVCPSKLAAYYSAADLHVFPSLGDVWGLVVNEAGLCGVPTLCSTHAACAVDLIDEDRNGLVFDPLGTSALASLTAALRRPDLAQLGKEARRVAEQHTPARLAASFRSAATRSVA